MRTAYIGLESLRNSLDLISKHVATWAVSNIRFVEHMDVDWQTTQRKLWDLLDVHPDTASDLIDLQLRFEGGALLVSDKLLTDQPDFMSLVVASLLNVWRFSKWTESRWLTVGASARALVAGVLTGISDLVAFILASGSSDWYIKGYLKLGQEHLQFMVEASLSSRVAECFQQELMEDSRVGRNYEGLITVLSEELMWLCQLEDEVWSLLGKACGKGGSEIKDHCIAHGASHLPFHMAPRARSCLKVPLGVVARGRYPCHVGGVA